MWTVACWTITDFMMVASHEPTRSLTTMNKLHYDKRAEVSNKMQSNQDIV